MDVASAVGIVGQTGQQTTTGHDAMSELDMNSFIKLLIAEFQNQDPLNPMSNTEILQQVGQIKSIESNQRLTQTLEAVRLQQNVATANSLLDRTVTALTDKNEKITAQVTGVAIEDGNIKLRLGEETAELTNVSEILPDGAQGQ